MAKTDKRLFAPFPIEMDEHPKIAPLSDAAFRALFEGTFYSRRMLSDGFLDERIVLKRWGQAVADELSSNDRERPSWVPVEGGWMIHDFGKHHPLRADIEGRRADVSAKRAEAGKRGNESRWSGNDVATASQTGRKRVANDRSETETETETRSKDLAISDADSFTEFWSMWPRSEGKAAAVKAWAKAAGMVAPILLLELVRGYVDHPNRPDAEFVPHASTWLNQERWKDGAPVARAGTQRPSKDARALSLIEQGRAMDEAQTRKELSA